MIGEDSIHSRRLLVYNGFPIKVYPFSKDFETVYGSMEEAMSHLSAIISGDPCILRSPTTGNSFSYGISFPWGYMENGVPVRKVDFYGFEFDGPWDECNPEWFPFAFKDGLIWPCTSMGCGTGLIILGREESLRRQIVEEGRELSHYLQEWPDIGELGPVEPEIVNIEK